MTVILPSRIAVQITDALRVAGRREVGGVLMGEHVGVEVFRVHDLTIQMEGGTFATFVRLVEAVIKPLRAFFQSTNHDYTRFNYLGEWHSHHSFALRPSGTDDATMFDLLRQADFGARFAVLMLARLSAAGELEHSVTGYQLGRDPFVGRVVPEPIAEPDAKN